MRQINPETGICFFRAHNEVALRALLSDADFSPLELSVDGARIDRWLEFGCVYVDGRRMRHDTPVAGGAVVRVHTRPKHYFDPAVHLSEFILENNPEFLILDKPPGLPTHPTLDNYVENAKTLLERELGLPLYTTHRLDVPTQGLLVIAKTKPAQKALNRSFSLGRVGKTYRALSAAIVAPGPYVHYMDPQSRVPKIIQSEPQQDWWTCRLEVKRAQKVGECYGHEIALLTGKTHQIRAQMAALSAPILGDVIYGGAQAKHLALECFQLTFKLGAREWHFTRPRSLIQWPEAGRG